MAPLYYRCEWCGAAIPAAEGEETDADEEGDAVLLCLPCQLILETTGTLWLARNRERQHLVDEADVWRRMR